MPPITRSRKHSNKSPKFYVFIDKTPKTAINKPVRTTAKDTNNKPKRKAPEAASAPRKTAKRSKGKAKHPVNVSTLPVANEQPPQLTDVGEPDDSLQRVLSVTRPSAVFATPPQSRPPPRPPRRPEHHSYDPKTTLPPQFMNDGTPSPEPGRRHSHHISARAPSLLPPSSPIHLSSSPVRPFHTDPREPSAIFLSTHQSGSPSQFRTPTRQDRKRKRTPLTQPHLQSEGNSSNNDDLFAHGVVDDLDEREDSIAWENAGSDKENHRSPPDVRGSDNSDNKNPPFMPIMSERGILQPRDPSLSPARSGDSDPFGFFATERLLKGRRAEKELSQPQAGPSDTPRGPRLPLGELTPADVAPAAAALEPVPLAASSPQSQPPTAPTYYRYSDSEVEDLYAPASPPHTPRERLPHARTTSPQSETTPVAAAVPLTPRNGDSARPVTMRRRRRKELHGVSERGSEAEASSAPSSPSPVKPVHTRPPVSDSQLDHDHQQSEEEEERERPRKRPKLRSRGKGKENARGKGPPRAEDPMEVARRVLENAPRRKLERKPKSASTSKRKSAVSESVEGGGGSGVHGGRSRLARRRGVTRTGPATSRGKRRSEKSRARKKEDESTPEELREKREHERQERIEYFKQLEGYELPKENVYVI